MSSSTFKGRYNECSGCVYHIKKDNKDNCEFSHSKIRKNANGTGISLERYFRFCGLFKMKDYLRSVDETGNYDKLISDNISNGERLI